MGRLSFLVAVGMVATSCGASETASSTTVAVLEELSTTTSVPPTTEAPTTSPPEQVDASDSVLVAYCQASFEADMALTEFQRSGGFFDPVATEAYFRDQVDRIDRTTAPAPIEEDFATFGANFRAVVDAMAKIGFDLMNGDTTEVDALGADPEATAVSDRLDAFELEYCDNPDDGGVDIADTVAGMMETPAGRALLAEGIAEGTSISTEDALCFIENTPADVVEALVDFADGTGQLTTALVTGMAAGLDACGLSFEDFA